MVKKVFSILAKVPCYICIGYLIANIVLFLGYYIKALGISYAVMEVAVENNYIPNAELSTLSKTLSKIGSPVQEDEQYVMAEGNTAIITPTVSDFGIYINTNQSVDMSDAELYVFNAATGETPEFSSTSRLTTTSSNVRRQYGKEITVGVGYVYHAVLPIPVEGKTYSADESVFGQEVQGGNISNWIYNRAATPVRITYKIPGLKYYPDLD